MTLLTVEGTREDRHSLSLDENFLGLIENTFRSY